MQKFGMGQNFNPHTLRVTLEDTKKKQRERWLEESEIKIGKIERKENKMTLIESIKKIESGNRENQDEIIGKEPGE